jgi:hypothetical protein
MISPIGAGYSSPVYIPAPELSDLQNSSATSDVSRKSAVRKGIAEYQDSFEPAKTLDAEKSRYEFHLEIDRKAWDVRRTYNLKMVDETQKAEQSKAYRPEPVEASAVVDRSLNAALSAKMLSMIRV